MQVPAYKCLAGEFLGDGVNGRGVTAEATLRCKNLNEIMNVEEVVTAQRSAGGHRGYHSTKRGTDGLDRYTPLGITRMMHVLTK